jgi:hypothetical protein
VLTLCVRLRLDVISLSGGSYEKSRLPGGNHFPAYANLLRSPASSPLYKSCSLLGVSTTAGPRTERATEACPVTKPPARPFVPPPPYWTDHGPDGFWYGTESLWTLLGVHGTWNIRKNVLEDKGGYRTKLTYWRRGFDWRRDEPELSVIAKRLDREASSVAAESASGVFVTSERPAMMTAIDIPSAGCWELTAQYGGDRLSFIVSVQP